MKTINRSLYKIEEEDKAFAEEKNWNGKDNTFIGNLAEIAACKYLNVEWSTAEKATADIIDNDGVRYQVKGTREGFKKKRYWLEQSITKQFDRYIFVVVDEEEKFAKIEMDVEKQIPHQNVHEVMLNGKRLQAIFRK